MPPFQSNWLMMSDVCKHCSPAPCLEACPTGAIFRTEFDTVMVQQDICNGCGYCHRAAFRDQLEPAFLGQGDVSSADFMPLGKRLTAERRGLNQRRRISASVTTISIGMSKGCG